MRTQPNEIEKAQMDRALAEYHKELVMEAYGKTPGPQVLSMIKGIPAMEAAEILDKINPARVNGITSIYTLAHALGKNVESASMVQEDSVIEINKPRTVIKFSDRFPSLAQWLEKNKTRFGIVRVGHSFAYVAFGMVIKQFGFEGLRGKVIHVIWLDR